jgi:ubiquinone/menaquinone biosynthesis C-methylase UbiE
VSRGQWAAWRRAAVPFIVGTRIIDIGCGTGRFLIELRQLGYQAVGVDRSPAMWRMTQRNLVRAGDPNYVIGADGRSLPFPSESFDSATLTFPTPVLRDPRLWKELARVIRPEGTVIVVLEARTRRGGRMTILDLVSHVTSEMSAAAKRARDGKVEPPIAEVLFMVERKWVEVEGSQVLLIVARRK